MGPQEVCKIRVQCLGTSLRVCVSGCQTNDLSLAVEGEGVVEVYFCIFLWFVCKSVL